MRAVLYDATVAHARREPVDNRFRYRTHYWLVDLDQLPRLGPLARFEARDHLGDPTSTLRANVDRFLALRGVDLGGGRVLMLAHPRVLGYVFNPLSVFWCHDATGRLAAVVAEVHNTYGDRHAYLVHTDEGGRADTDKGLYVSPFFGVDGRYRLRLPPPGERLILSVQLHRDGHPPFVATLQGRRRPATLGGALLLSLRHPWTPLRTTALIRWQGIKLWLRGLRVTPRPAHAGQEGVQ